MAWCVIGDDFRLKSFFRALSLESQIVVTDIAGKPVEFEVIVENRGFTVSPGNNEIEYPNKGARYVLLVAVNLREGPPNNGAVEFWIETYIGGEWVASPISGKVLDFTKSADGFILYNESFTLVEGVNARLMARATAGEPVLQSELLDNGVMVPSITVNVQEVT